MATLTAPKRRPILTDLDKELLMQLLRQSQTSQESYIRESALGVPWGSLANSLVGGMLVGRERSRARNLEKQRDKAAVALLQGRGTDLQPQLFKGGEFEAGEYTTPAGNFVTQLAPVEQGVGETREQYLARKLRDEQIVDEKAIFNQFIADQPDKASYVSTGIADGYTGTARDPLSAALSGDYRGESLQPIEEITEREEILPQEIKEGITIEGYPKDPDWWDRNIRGAVPDATVANRIELAQLAGYDPLEWAVFEKEYQEGEGTEFDFENISEVILTDGATNFPTKVAAKTTTTGTITQHYLDPVSGTWKPLAGSGLQMVTKDATQNRAETAMEGRIATVKQWLKARGHEESPEFVMGMANAFSGDTTRENLQTGQLYSELDAVYESLKNIKDTFDESKITSQVALTTYKQLKPTKGKILEDKVNNLAQDIVKADVSANYVVLNKIQEILDKNISDIPGFGKFESLVPGFFISKDGRKLRQIFATVQNMTLKDRSGAAVTDPEFERFKEEIPTFFKNEEQLRIGIKGLRDMLNGHLGSLYATYPEYVSKIYATRPNALRLNQADVKAAYQKYIQ